MAAWTEFYLMAGVLYLLTALLVDQLENRSLPENFIEWTWIILLCVCAWPLAIFISIRYEASMRRGGTDGE